MGELPLALHRATLRDHDVIIELINAAADWLRTKNTDQWAQPWPSEEDRNHRIRQDLIAGKTWIAWEGGTAAATITADPAENPIWPAQTRRDPAVYVCRLVVGRAFSGRGLGAALLDWAGLRAQQSYEVRWIRVDVWTTNTALHAYYKRLGFESCGFSEASGYPSAALFQKETGRIRPPGQALFRIHPPCGG
ncbi:MAG TPA: GNAT family N-acetyltransferase [Streptosporangiaceae bacterium]|nr:GNAT family N-acetyltransferase [Streptosporangiaceae bacterium]